MEGRVPASVTLRKKEINEKIIFRAIERKDMEQVKKLHVRNGYNVINRY
jgi:hypothetical protein